MALGWLYGKMEVVRDDERQSGIVQFSIVELFEFVKSNGHSLFDFLANVQMDEVEEALLFLSNIGALKLDGGFMVLYQAMTIHRLKESRLRYKLEDYRMLDEFYKQKIQQVHIVGEYANLMVRDYATAQQYVRDYFQMDYKRFISKYFKGERNDEIQRNITPGRYKKLFAKLSERQNEIIDDGDSRCIVVAAGPGSGKTMVLVHKLASLLLLEDVKHEQLLMLTFSRAAATEFKQRLIGLIGDVAYYVEIKTFHSYSFDLLGRIGNLEDSNVVVARAAEMVAQGEVEPSRIAKTVLVIDEAQDMSAEEYALVRALMNRNEEMRVIAVGDDDQNIYEFRGSDSKYLYQLSQEQGGRIIEMTENFRSSHHVVETANAFAKQIRRRMKSTPGIAKRNEQGWVEVTRHVSQQMYQPLVDNLLRHYGNGTSCVLAQTNEEAMMLVALLRKHGIKSKLVQSMDDIRFINLAEVRYFMRYISKRNKAPLIPDDLWDEAKRATFEKYAKSNCLPFVKRCVQLFEQVNRAKYHTDLKEFIFDSSIEDFYVIPKAGTKMSSKQGSGGAEVIVSTIHKAKGHEFDDVYLLIADRAHKDDALLRQYYVGMTRARNRLFIHTNGDLFSGLPRDQWTVDLQHYPLPVEMVLQLSLKDVFLDFFKPLKRHVLDLRSGDELIFQDNYFLQPDTHRAVAKLSSSMEAELAEWKTKGYVPCASHVRFVGAWKPKDADKEEAETAVLLIDLKLSKTN
jgi:ATP-dependent DNA helicase RecQ